MTESDYKSQYDQDKFCYENFLCHVPYKGFFVEVGASDGIKFSNTYFYEKLGWTGLCVEPRVKIFPTLTKNRKCFCENVGIAKETKDDVKFLEIEGYGEGMSGIVENYHPRHTHAINNYIKPLPEHKGSEFTMIRTVTLQNLLTKYTLPHIHFLSVDTEGGELGILQTIDWDQTTVDVITVENNYENDKHFNDYLSKLGFHKVAKLVIDEVYVHFKFLASINRFQCRVAFLSSWAGNSQLQKEYSVTLPNGKNWKNIFPSSIEEADVIVVMDDVKDTDEKVYRGDTKVLVFPREPPEVNSRKKYLKYNLPYGYTYDSIYHCVPQFNFLQTNINKLDALEYKKDKSVSCIVSGKTHTPGARQRVSFIDRLRNAHPNLVDIYGKGLGFGKGEIPSKMEGLVSYRYSLCMENSQHNNYFTEKFTDAIVCWCVPIYWGCPNISEYFPPGSYHYLNITADDAIEKFIQILQEPVDIVALTHARNLILSQYNVWNTIDRVLRQEKPIVKKEKIPLPEIYGFFGFKQIYDEAVHLFRDGDNILEIGAFLGKSTSYMCDLIKKSGKKINFYVVDPWEKVTASPSGRIQATLPDDMFGKFKDNMRERGHLGSLYPIKAFSKDAYASLKHLKFRFIFVDGSHSYEDVKEDLRLYGPLTMEGGMFAGDDYQAEGVKRAVDEYLRPEERRIIHGTGNIMWVKIPQKSLHDKNDNRGTGEQINEILTKFQVSGKILAIGDSASSHAILNLDYFRRNTDKIDCIGVNCDPHALGKFNHFTIVQGNGNKMDFSDDKFDCVMAAMLFEHDLYFWKTVTEVKRVLKPGGVFITTVPCFVDTISKEYKDGTITYMLHEAPNVDDYYRFSEKALKQFFFSEFENVVTKRYQSPPRMIAYGWKKTQTPTIPLNTFLNGLPHSPEGHWRFHHLPIIQYVTQTINPSTALEIGLNNGYSTAMWLYTAPRMSIHSVDIGFHPFVASVQKKFSQYFSGRFTHETMNSLELHNKEYPLYDLVIIDGCHKHDVCLSDLLFSLCHGRYILLDDTKGGSPGVNTAWKQFEDENPDAFELVKEWFIQSGSRLYKNKRLKRKTNLINDT